MGESSGSVSIDIEMIPFGGKEYLVETSKGSISVFVSGDQEKPALITYPDVALNYMSCFQGLFFHPDAASLLLNRFCIYHIDAPGHEMGAAVISADIPLPSVDDLADQVVEVLDFFGLKVVLCLGATAGAYVLALFAMKYRERVLGLILVSPLCRAPSWTEWFYNKVMLNLLYFYGMCGMLKEWLLKRYFSEEVRSGTQGAESYIVQACRREVRSGTQGAESDIVQACRRLLDERQSSNVMRFLEAINQRYDLSEGLRKLHCRTLVFVGESSPFHSEALHMRTKLDGRICTLVEVPECGSLVTEEQPHAMVIPIEQFLLRCGFHRLPPPPPSPLRSPSGPLSSSRTLPELPSVESLGLKLKPIKTRVQFEV